MVFIDGSKLHTIYFFYLIKLTIAYIDMVTSSHLFLIEQLLARADHNGWDLAMYCQTYTIKNKISEIN